MVAFQHPLPCSFELASPTNDILCNIWKAEAQHFLFLNALNIGASGWVPGKMTAHTLAHPGDVQQRLDPQFLQLLLDLLLQLLTPWPSACTVPRWRVPSSLSSHPVSLRLEVESLSVSDQFLLMDSVILLSSSSFSFLSISSFFFFFQLLVRLTNGNFSSNTGCWGKSLQGPIHQPPQLCKV